MRHMVGLLYLLTALMALYWAVYLTMTGLYGAPFSRWYVVVFIGGLVLLAGSVLWWTSASAWTRWIPIIGSFLLAAYFVPAFVTMLCQGRTDLVRVILVAMVIASVIVALSTRQIQVGQ